MITTRLWNKPQQRRASALRLWPARESRAPVFGEPRTAALLLTAGARPHPLSPAPCLGVPTSGAKAVESERADSAPSLQRQGRHEGSPLHGTPARGQSTAGPEPRRIRGARAGWEPPRGCVQGGPRRAASAQVERPAHHRWPGSCCLVSGQPGAARPVGRTAENEACGLCGHCWAHAVANARGSLSWNRFPQPLPATATLPSPPRRLRVLLGAGSVYMTSPA